MGLVKSISISLATLLLLSAFTVASSSGHLEEHILNSAHTHSHNGSEHSHKHDSGPGHHTIAPTPLLPAKERQFLLALEHRFSGDGPIFSYTLLSRNDFENPERLVSLATPETLLFPLPSHPSLNSGRAPPL